MEDWEVTKQKFDEQAELAEKALHAGNMSKVDYHLLRMRMLNLIMHVQIVKWEANRK